MTLRILGAGGHSKIVLEAWRSTGGTVSTLYDDDPTLRGRSLLGVEVAGSIRDGLASPGSLHVAVGDNCARARIVGTLGEDRFPPIVHAAAEVSPSATCGRGTLVCAGAVVQAEATLGRHVIVNSLALVEHDVLLDDFVHLAPGSRLGGRVRVCTGAMIGLGAIVLPGLTIGSWAMIGAGAVVISDVPSHAVLVGNPARAIDRGVPRG
ncbi:acetyltransferase [Sphingosinicella sp. CPCC 101087]|uniref:acetyltransferase n=1 Tax=Sphingosinicella sp. CPCC 101087 TaxID=2497754 RepID=UPI00101BB244|nr:acetyltransferase [Sphingosinicella sp. CPCC 101087]